MKKLVIVAAVAMSAIALQASQWKWSAANIYDGTGAATTDTKYSGTAYLYDMSKVSMQTLLDGYAADSSYDYASLSLANRSVATGGINGTGSEFEYDSKGENVSFYFAIFEDDKVYFSTVKANIAPNEKTPPTVGFGSQNGTTATTGRSASLPLDTGVATAGYWHTVPEPTSGLLLLLGVAGLALRRRRA